MTTNQLEGVIENVSKSQPSAKYPKCCNWYLTIDGSVYQVFAGTDKESSFKVGDRVKFNWTAGEFQGMPTKNFKIADFYNLTNPAATEKKSGGFGGGYKPDPERDLRIARQSSLERAITFIENKKVDASKEQVILLAEYFTNWVMTGEKPKKADTHVHKDDQYAESSAYYAQGHPEHVADNDVAF